MRTGFFIIFYISFKKLAKNPKTLILDQNIIKNQTLLFFFSYEATGKSFPLVCKFSLWYSG